MSVINQMLRDLQARRAGLEPFVAAGVGVAASAPAGPRTLRRAAWVGGLTLAVAVIAWGAGTAALEALRAAPTQNARPEPGETGGETGTARIPAPIGRHRIGEQGDQSGDRSGTPMTPASGQSENGTSTYSGSGPEGDNGTPTYSQPEGGTPMHSALHDARALTPAPQPAAGVPPPSAARAPSPATAAVDERATPAPVEAAGARPVAPSPSPGAELGHVRLGVDGRRTRVVLELAGAPREPRRVLHADGSVDIVLPDTRLATTVPRLSARDPILAAAYATGEGGEVRLRFEPRDRALGATYEQVTRDSSHPHWLLVDLFELNPGAPVEPAQAEAASPVPRERTPRVTAKPAAVPAPPGRKTRSGPAAAAADSSPPRMRVAQRPPSAAQQVQASLAAGREALGDGDDAGAQRHFERALALSPANAAARELLVAMQLRRGDLDAAIANLEQALALEPSRARFARPLARLLAERGDLARALAALRGALAEGRTDARFLALLAALEQRAEQYEPAASHYVQALALEPQNATWWLGLGVSLEAAGRGAEALAAFREARRLGDLPAELRRFLGERIAALGRATG